jgi:hypothetical protein
MFIVKADIKTNSYIGGNPVLPSGVDSPKSKCDIPLTFFFTIEFPATHALSGYTLSFFSATDEFDENLTIPEMLSTNLKNAIIPNGFLRTYQKLFKTYLFKTETAQTLNTASRIKLQYLEFSTQENGEIFGWAGLPQKWILEDEAPSTYEGESLDFLLQVKRDQTFDITDTAPPQKEFNIFGGEKDRKKRNYFFFNQNETYFFGQPSKAFDNNVYILTQCD